MLSFFSVDSSFTDQAMKFQVTEAAKLAKEGASLEEILAKIEEVKEKTEVLDEHEQSGYS